MCAPESSQFGLLLQDLLRKVLGVTLPPHPPGFCVSLATSLVGVFDVQELGHSFAVLGKLCLLNR